MSDDSLTAQAQSLLDTAGITVELRPDAEGDFHWSGPGGLSGTGSTPLDAAHNALRALNWAAEDLVAARTQVQVAGLELLRQMDEGGAA